MDVFEAGAGLLAKDDGRNKVHIRMQQRNGKKSWTTVEGIPLRVDLPTSGQQVDVDFNKILRALKKTFKTNGTLKRSEEHGVVIQLQGDIRKEVAEFLLNAPALVGKEQVMIHGA
eukprot:CAMPEP_0171096804 /NCGR_PEP_ID=MMETSP0766_2-20121228/45989_1 /TAXON_ID=439317 /ORGANISM="Gambierdiscus australes, Strain CAWD 149" /LENGTH=114 /DNA_ID=CAMNT_0011555871 /DNA_START=74 /DNA_END=418 /DNA_ORIENTATION=-